MCVEEGPPVRVDVIQSARSITNQSVRTPSASSTDHEIFQLHLSIGIISHRVLFFIVKRKIVGKC